MSDAKFKRVRSRRPSLGLAMATSILLLAAAGGLAQPQEAEPAGLATEILESFEAVPLADGWLLQPRDTVAGFRGVELRGAELAIDGTLVSADELRARLGTLARPILELAALDDGQRRALLSESGGTLLPSPAAITEITEEPAEPSEPAAVPAPERRERRERRDVVRSDAQVVVGSSVTIEEDEVARDVLVVGGSLSVRGLVKGDAVAVGGSIEVDGEVTGDVAAIGASVDLEPGARVVGDAVSIGGTVNVAEGATVEGRIQEVPFLPSLRIGGWGEAGAKTWHGPDVSVGFSPMKSAFGFAWAMFSVALLALLALLTLLVARGPVERVGEQVAAEPWKSGLVGLLSQILFLPLLVLLVIILVVSIVGIPFLLLLPFALLAIVLICLLGYTAVAASLGWWSKERFGWSFTSPFVALLVGIGLIEVWSLIGEVLSLGPGPLKFFAVMFALFGGLLCYVVWTVGFGGALLSRFGAARGWGGSPPAAGASDWKSPEEAGFPASEGTQDESGSSAYEPPMLDDGPGGWTDTTDEGQRQDE